MHLSYFAITVASFPANRLCFPLCSESQTLGVTATSAAHPAPASRQRSGASQPQPAARMSSGGLGDITTSMPLNQAPPPPLQARPAHRPQTRPPSGMIWLWYTQYSKLITCCIYER